MGLSIEQQFVKRVIDIIGSMIGIIITIPFFIVIGLSIKLTDHGTSFLYPDTFNQRWKTV